MKKIIVGLMVVAFLVFMGIAPSAHALSTYWDVAHNFNTDDDDSLTQVFNQVQYYANTTSSQDDTDGDKGLSVGDQFSDAGNAYATALLPANSPIDTESLGSKYEFTFVWTDLGGYISEINPGATTDTMTTVYNAGTINIYMDTPGDTTTWASGMTAWASHGTNMSTDDDVGFNDGTLVATISNMVGLGHLNFDKGTMDFTGGDYHLTGQFTYLYDDFWFEYTGDDLLEKYVDMGWLMAYTAGDTDPKHFNQNMADPSLYPLLFTLDANHDSSFELNVIPEPATMLLLGTGLIGLAGLGRRRFAKKG